MSINLQRLMPTTVFVLVFLLAAPLKAAEYKGTCYFNAKKMPCSVSQNPFTLTMRWADGAKETYAIRETGYSLMREVVF